MLNKGETALPYAPYFEGLRDSKVTAIESESANVYCGTEQTKITSGNITYEWNAVEQIISISGTVSSVAESFIPLKSALNITGGTTYTMLATNITDSSTVTCSYGVCDKRHKYDVGGGYSNLAMIGATKTHTFASDAIIDTIHIFVHSAGTVNVKFKLMINKGSTALPYAPYVKHTFPIPEAVQALEGYGQGVNKDYYNKVVIDPDNFIKKYVKNVNKLEWNGTENMSAQNYASHFTVQQFNVRLSGATHGEHVVCDRFPTTSGVTSGNRFGIWLVENYIIVGVPKSWLTPFGYVEGTSSTYVSSFKAYLKSEYDKGTPMTFVYGLPTPTETDISDIVPDDNFIRVYGVGTVTAVNEYKQDVPTKITYQYKEATV